MLGYSLSPLTWTAGSLLGQPSFASSSPNQGLGAPSDQSLDSPMALSLDTAGRLFVADRDNQRVIAYDPPSNPSLQLVYGQGSPSSAFIATSSDGMHSPSGLWAAAAGNLLVADSSNHRVMIYGCSAGVFAATPTFSPTRTFTVSPTQTVTLSASPTPSITLSRHHLRDLHPDPGTFSITPTLSFSATASQTPSVTPTLSNTQSLTPSVTPSITVTFSKTATPLPSQTPYPQLSSRALSYPNPALRSSGRVSIAFPAGSSVQIDIFDMLIQKVISLDAGSISGQKGFAVWDLKNSGGQLIVPGIYYYKVQSDGRPFLGKMTVQ